MEQLEVATSDACVPCFDSAHNLFVVPSPQTITTHSTVPETYHWFAQNAQDVQVVVVATVEASAQCSHAQINRPHHVVRIPWFVLLVDGHTQGVDRDQQGTAPRRTTNLCPFRQSLPTGQLVGFQSIAQILSSCGGLLGADRRIRFALCAQQSPQALGDHWPDGGQHEQSAQLLADQRQVRT